MHRPFDGAFRPNYPAELALRQCTEVARRLVGQPSTGARDRAYTMLLMAETGLHSFDYDAGRRLHSYMEEAEMEEDAKRGVPRQPYLPICIASIKPLPNASGCLK